MIPLFIIDPWFAKPDKVCANRYNFLLETLQDLDDSLKKIGSRLVVVQGKPTEILPELFKEWKVNRLYFEKDTEPFAVARDKDVVTKAKSMGCETVITHGHTLFDCDVVLTKAKGKLTTSYQGFQKLLESCPVPAKPIAAPTKDEMPAITLAADLLKSRGGHDSASLNVPSLESLGYRRADVTTPFKGGETVALASFEKSMARKAWVAKFEKPDTSPTALSPDTTALSPHLKFGSLSCRLFYWRLQEIYKEQKGHSQPPVSLEGQLLWREFFYAQSYSVPNFDRMVGNPVCKQIPWDHNPEFVKAWEEGRTGYPWIDAAMTQLKQEGWLHHLARHAVACFLTRGDLYCSWEAGAKVFDRLLLDSDWALNNGNVSANQAKSANLSFLAAFDFHLCSFASASLFCSGCGCLRAPTSTSSSESTAPWPSPRRQTRTATTSASTCPSSRTSPRSTSTSRGKPPRRSRRNTAW